MDTAHIIDLCFKSFGSIGIFIAIQQLYETKKRRMVDMYWKISDIYLSKEMQESRHVLDRICEMMPNLKVYRDGKNEIKENEKLKLIDEYIKHFHDAKKDTEAGTISRKARSRIRFLNQAGILVRKRLIDKDMLFGLIGAGFKIDYPLLEIIVRCHRKAHGSRKMYDHVEYLWEKYNRWEKSVTASYPLQERV